MEDDSGQEPVDMWATDSKPVPVRKNERNPYDIALAVIWVVALAVSVVLLLTGVLTDSGFKDQAARAADFKLWGGIFFAAGFLSLIAHLASFAARWTPRS